MTDDLVVRLRSYDKHNHRGQYAKLVHEAADAIESLTKEVAEWRACQVATIAKLAAAEARLVSTVLREPTQAQVNAFIKAWASVRPLMEDNPYYALECAQAIWRAMFDAATSSLPK